MIGLIFELTNKCNLSCKWCGVKKGKDVLSYDKIISIIEKNKPKWVEFTGGEPLLRKDIFDLIDYCKSRRTYTCLNTNGTLINDKIAKRLNADIIRISIDGLEKVNDKIRGKGSFKKAVNAIESLKKHNKKIIISTAIGKLNKNEPKKIIKYFYPRIKNFMFGRVLPTPELKYKECISTLETIKIYLSLLPYRLNPLLRINYAMQFGALFYFNFIPPEVLADGKVISCCIDRGNVIGSIKQNKKLRSKPCLLFFSNCEKCLRHYFKNDNLRKHGFRRFEIATQFRNL
ncbi:radical SAM protein [Candidatus Woesearchaeota archaeon]|nr:radical SAM protein [Candidatus Woesearchaeota archaeon]